MSALREMLNHLGKTALLLALAPLCACVSKDTATPSPPASREALDISGHAREALEAGDSATAQKLYLRAVELHRSVDNAEGVARNLVNLAVVQDKSGQPAAAAESLAALDRFITLRRAALPGATESADLSTSLTEARLLRVRLLMGQGRLDAAESALAQAGGADSYRAANARARLRIAQGRHTDALAEASRAWTTAGRARDATARSDAARLAATATEALGRHEEALAWNERALQTEREVGRPAQIAEGWLGVARSARSLGRHEQARAAALRAQEISRAAGDTAREKQARALLAVTPGTKR